MNTLGKRASIVLVVLLASASCVHPATPEINKQTRSKAIGAAPFVQESSPGVGMSREPVSPADSNVAIENDGWKTYTSDAYGIRFRYPDHWTNHGDVFTAPPEVGVLDIGIVVTSATSSLERLAEIDIYQDCGRIIRSDDRASILYVRFCSAMSETYVYLFKNVLGQVISLSYHDDFAPDVSEKEKLIKFEQLISTIMLLPR